MTMTDNGGNDSETERMRTEIERMFTDIINRYSVSDDEGLESVCVRGVLGVARDVDGALLQEKALVALGLLVEVEAGLHLNAGLVERAGHPHGSSHLGGVVRVEVAAVGDEVRDLPAALGVLVDEGLVDA